MPAIELNDPDFLLVGRSLQYYGSHNPFTSISETIHGIGDFHDALLPALGELTSPQLLGHTLS